MILTQEYSRVASRYDSGNRAWLISPQGKVYSCGYNHNECKKNRDIQEYIGSAEDVAKIEDLGWSLVRDGWMRAGVFTRNSVYFEAINLNDRMLEAVRDLFWEMGLDDSDEVDVTWNGTHRLTWGDFKDVDYSEDLMSLINRQRHLRFGGDRKQAALPDSRNHLKNISLEELSYPLQKAFSLTGLDDGYKEMSLEQISSKLRQHELLLEDETGWTADELIRDMNQLLE